MDTRWIDELAAEVPDMQPEAHQIKRFTTVFAWSGLGAGSL